MWREKVGEKYTSLPGIRELHDFVTIVVPPNKMVMKVREKCYSGALRDTPTKVRKSMPLIHVYPRLQTLIVLEGISDPYLKTRWDIFSRCMLTSYHK